MKNFSIIAICLSSLTLVTGCTVQAEQPNSDLRTPNIVLLVVDTLRGDAVLQEAGFGNTPGFDSLAENGVIFPAAFSHAPMTLPSHTSLFSSRPPFETGVLNNWQSVREDLPLLAEWLGRFGYQTHAVVSLGTLDKRDKPALDRGFDHFDQDYWHMEQAPDALARIRTTLDELDQDRPFFLFAHFSDPHAPYNLHEDHGSEAEVFVDGKLVATLPTSDMSKWDREIELESGEHELEIRAETPFRINSLEWTKNGKFMGPTWEVGAVRTPGKRVLLSYTAKNKVKSRLRLWIAEALEDENFIEKRYNSEVRWMDESIGNLVQELKDRKLYDNTLLVFTSDHGEGFGEHGAIGHVQNLYDEMLHVPLVIKPLRGDARMARLSTVRAQMVPHQDIVPTILELAQIPSMPGSRGTSILAPGREPLLIAETHKPEAHRNLICLRDDEYKLIYDYDAETYEFYDLTNDPDERRNLYKPDQVERAEWVDQIRQVADLVQTGGMIAGNVSEETRELLDALGYAGVQ